MTSSVVELIDVRIDLPSQFAVAALVEADAPYRKIEIPLGLPEANSLAHALKRIKAARPLTHELFVSVMSRFNIEVAVVRITGRSSGVYTAELELTSPKGREVIDCRPSDAMTLAMRFSPRPPILLDDRLFESSEDV
ncbi:MAG: bifunctional nuclease family protein [Acidimicrobiales bacterium]